MGLLERVEQLEARAKDYRGNADLVIASDESTALLEAMNYPELFERKRRIPDRVKWELSKPEATFQFLKDCIIDDDAAKKRREQRIAKADAVLTRLGV